MSCLQKLQGNVTIPRLWSCVVSLKVFLWLKLLLLYSLIMRRWQGFSMDQTRYILESFWWRELIVQWRYFLHVPNLPMDCLDSLVSDYDYPGQRRRIPSSVTGSLFRITQCSFGVLHQSLSLAVGNLKRRKARLLLSMMPAQLSVCLNGLTSRHIGLRLCTFFIFSIFEAYFYIFI